MEQLKYLQQKRTEVLKTIKPICDSFNIDCDYIIEEKGQRETLIIDEQKIGCSSNSVSAVIDEVIGFLFVRVYCRNRYIPFKTQITNRVKEYWIE